MIETEIHVKTDHFDGPMALLLHLVQREEMPIKDLDINHITEEYLGYLTKMQNLNFDVAGEYLFMAAQLLFLKSKECVTESEKGRTRQPGEENFEITTKTQLIQRLEELLHFQKLGEALWKLPRRDEDVFVKPKVNRKEVSNSILAPMDLQELTNSMIDWIKRENRKYTAVKRDRLSIKEKLKRLKESLSFGEQTEFEKLLDNKEDKVDIVITFISLLELARLNKLEISQSDEGQIYIEVKEDLNTFNVETADGFEPEEEDDEIKAEDLIAKVDTTHDELGSDTLH